MAIKQINLGSSAGAGDGEPLYSALQKTNENFTDHETRLNTIENGVVRSDGTVVGTLLPNTNVAYDIGSATKRFKDLYLSGNTIDLGGTALSIVAGKLQVGGANVSTTVDYNDLQNKPTIPADVGDLTDTGGLLGVSAWADITGKPTTISGFGITDAFDGAYSSLSGTPTIPTATSDLTNDSGFLTSIAVTGTYNGPTATITDYIGIDNPYEAALPQYDSSVGGWTSLKFPLYQDTTDNDVAIFSSAQGGWINSALKTVNGTSLLGSGDVTISGGASTLGALSDVNNTAPSWNNQPLVWDGSSEWKPGEDLTAVNLRAFTKLTLDGQGTYVEWISNLSPPFYTIKLNITGNATQNETITLPNATGTIALTSDIPADVGDLTDTGGLLSGGGGADLSAVNQNYTPDTDNAYDLGIAAGNFLRSGYFKTSVVIDNATLTYNAQGELESSAGIKTGNLRTYGLYSDAYMSLEPKYGGLIFWMDGDPGGGTLGYSNNNGSNEMTWSGDLYSNGPTYQLDKDQANLQIGAEVTKTISGVTLGATTSLSFSDPYYFNPNSTVTITGVVGTTELNNQTYFINSSNELFTDAALTTPLNSSAFTAYVSGGTAVVAPRATMSLPVLHSPPSNPVDGMMAIADGTNWNPVGLGNPGFYIYYNGQWWLSTQFVI